MQRYRRVEPGVADVNEAFNALSSVNDAGPLLESSCAENPNSLFGAEGALAGAANRQTGFLRTKRRSVHMSKFSLLCSCGVGGYSEIAGSAGAQKQHIPNFSFIESGWC
jgi:hypothetical protein